MLYSDYFTDAPLHGDKTFRRRYRMSRKLFLRIVNSIREFDSYFKCKKDCTGKLGLNLEVHDNDEDACIWSSW